MQSDTTTTKRRDAEAALRVTSILDGTTCVLHLVDRSSADDDSGLAWVDCDTPMDDERYASVEAACAAMAAFWAGWEPTATIHFLVAAVR